MPKTRTAGDGMESEETAPEVIKIKESVSKNPKLSKATERLIQIFPGKMVAIEKRNSQVLTKSPKFVPYEPYKGAVKPIVPQKLVKGSKKLSRNNMDINTLISQMSQMDTKLSEYRPRAKLRSASEKSIEPEYSENLEMKKRIEELVQEKEIIKDQLKQQVQVKLNTSLPIPKSEVR